MIRVEIKKDVITVKGHANQAVSGNDIVCASVSTVIATIVNITNVINIDSTTPKIIYSAAKPLFVTVEEVDAVALEKEREILSYLRRVCADPDLHRPISRD